MEPSKQDWKLFREKLTSWQEAYMERLNHEYMVLLVGEGNPSDKFWELYKRIHQDKQSPGVALQLRKQNLAFDIVALISDGVITLADLEGFSDDIIETVRYLYSRNI